MWDYDQPIGPLGADQRGPYSAGEMTQYLFINHYHWATSEPPLELGAPVFVGERDTHNRHFWLWQVGDQWKRTWYLLAASGDSPFGDSRHCHRWVRAVEAEDENWQAFLAHEIAYLEA